MDQAWELIGKDVITKQGLYLAAQRRDFLTVRLGRRILVPRQKFEEFLQIREGGKIFRHSLTSIYSIR